jgi:hypothetical protein
MAVSHSPLTNDAAKVFGALTNGGSLVISNAGTATLAAGDSFKLFTAASYTGAFATVTLPSLMPGLAWKTNSLNSAGQLSVISILPSFTNTLIIGTNLVLRGAGGLPNGKYYVLASTNLALPLTSWNRIATNAYDAAGNFSCTNFNAFGGSNIFYALQLP